MTTHSESVDSLQSTNNVMQLIHDNIFTRLVSVKWMAQKFTIDSINVEFRDLHKYTNILT